MGSGIGRALAEGFTGVLKGENEANAEQRRRAIEDHDRKIKEQIQRVAMVETLADINRKEREANAPMPWHPTTRDEAVDYYKATHPERPVPASHKTTLMLSDGRVATVDPTNNTATLVTLDGQPVTGTPKSTASPHKVVFRNDDGGVVVIDEGTHEATPVILNGQPLTGTSKNEARLQQMRKQRQQEQAQEAEGLAMLNSGMPGPLSLEFGRAYRAARLGNPTLSPGRLAGQVIKGLKQTRPDLFPQPPLRGGKSGLAAKYGKPHAVSPTSSPSDVAPVPSVPSTPNTQAPAPKAATGADRWQDLVDQGVPKDEATRRVQQEFGQ